MANPPFYNCPQPTEPFAYRDASSDTYRIARVWWRYLQNLYETTGKGTGIAAVTQVNTSTGLTGGPITTTGTIQVAANGITNALLAQGAASTLKGNPTAALANETDLTLDTPLLFSGGKLSLNRFTSSQQVITSAGALTLAHGLGVQPFGVSLKLHCTTAQANYSIGDEIEMHPTLLDASGATNRGVSIVPDATNLNIRYGSDANAFAVLNKTTGTANALTNANFTAIFRAWA